MNYFRIEEVLSFHDLLIKKYGGLSGIRDLGLLSSALAMPKHRFENKELHQGIAEKAAAYMYHLIKNHPFYYGNKRTAVFILLVFLKRNKVRFSMDPFVLEELAVAIANNEINKTDLAKHIAASIN